MNQIKKQPKTYDNKMKILLLYFYRSMTEFEKNELAQWWSIVPARHRSWVQVPDATV